MSAVSTIERRIIRVGRASRLTPTRIKVLLCALFLAVVESAHGTKKIVEPEEILQGFGIALTTPAVIEALEHQNVIIRSRAVEVLGKRKELSATSPLLERLQDDNVLVRVAAAEALLNLGNNAGLNILKEALASENKDVVLQAASVLCNYEDENGISTLKALLTASEWYIRKMAITVLERCANFPEKQTFFLRAAHDRNTNVRLTALEALVSVPDQAVIDLLIQTLKAKDDVLRFAANKWLQQLTHQSFGFRHTAPLEQREDATRKWESWWKDNKDQFAAARRAE